jgi:superfamily II DNA helicase RecQ
VQLLIQYYIFICCSGRGQDKKVAFREAYSKLSEMRSFFGSKVPVIALTATASKHMISCIKKDLGIPACTDVLDNPNKTNITYIVKTVSGGLEDNFQWCGKSDSGKRDRDTSNASIF